MRKYYLASTADRDDVDLRDFQKEITAAVHQYMPHAQVAVTERYYTVHPTPDCPLDLHCTYTRDQLLVALDFMNPNSVREGVKWLPDKQIDVLFVTLNKSDKDYSPTTMYNDYSINEELFHWQSQSTTTDTGTVGQRYIHHRERSSKVLLFVREFKSDLVGAAPYTFLGTANYVKHNGSRPMNITWKLDHPIPAKYLKKTKKLVVG